jgi:hypothetical protein
MKNEAHTHTERRENRSSSKTEAECDGNSGNKLLLTVSIIIINFNFISSALLKYQKSSSALCPSEAKESNQERVETIEICISQYYRWTTHEMMINS